MSSSGAYSVPPEQHHSPPSGFHPSQASTYDYSDGLQVVPPSEPEWVTGGAQDMSGMIPADTEYYAKKEAEAKGHPFAGAANEPDQGPAPRRPWYKRKLILGILAGVLVLAIALGVGLGVGLSNKSSKDSGSSSSGSSDGDSDSGSSGDGGSSGDSGSDSDSSDKKTAPDCKDDLCARILTMPVYNDELYVMGRTAQNTIAYRAYNGSRWADWKDLGETVGKLVSQPTAMAWKPLKKYNRLEMAAISSSENTVYERYNDKKEGWDDWSKMNPGAGSAISMCSPSESRVDMWTIDNESRNITHTFWLNYSDIPKAGEAGDTGEIGTFSRAAEPRWESQPLVPTSKSAPAVVCRDSSTYHDIIWYAEDEDAFYHAAWSDDDGWVTSSAFEGKWIGDPVLVTPPSDNDPEHWDFFGVQDNNKVYHMSWSGSGSGDGYGSLTNLGGSVVSAPAAVYLGDEGVIDIVALGKDGSLQHRHFDGSAWSDSWEDLGIWAYSAPTMTDATDSSVKKVVIAAVSIDGKLKTWTRDGSIKAEWKGSLKEQKLGGKLSLDYFSDDS